MPTRVVEHPGPIGLELTPIASVGDRQIVDFPLTPPGAMSLPGAPGTPPPVSALQLGSAVRFSPACVQSSWRSIDFSFLAPRGAPECEAPGTPPRSSRADDLGTMTPPPVSSASTLGVEEAWCCVCHSQRSRRQFSKNAWKKRFRPGATLTCLDCQEVARAAWWEEWRSRPSGSDEQREAPGYGIGELW